MTDHHERVDLEKQQREIERLRSEMSAKPREERRITTRATARILDNVESSAPAESVRALVRHAERACHAAQSFRHPIPVTLQTTLNGESLSLE